MVLIIKSNKILITPNNIRIRPQPHQPIPPLSLPTTHPSTPTNHIQNHRLRWSFSLGWRGANVACYTNDVPTASNCVSHATTVQGALGSNAAMKLLVIDGIAVATSSGEATRSSNTSKLLAASIACCCCMRNVGTNLHIDDAVVRFA